MRWGEEFRCICGRVIVEVGIDAVGVVGHENDVCGVCDVEVGNAFVELCVRGCEGGVYGVCVEGGWVLRL